MSAKQRRRHGKAIGAPPGALVAPEDVATGARSITVIDYTVAAVEEKTVAETLDKVIENQEAILAELKALKKNQVLMRKDLKYIRSKTH